MEHIRLGPGGEFDLIRDATRAAPAHPAVRVGPGDDCAVLADGTVISIDTSIEGVHFRAEWMSAREIGARAVITALSDLAAVAAEPVAVFVALTAMADQRDRAREVMAGVAAAANQAAAALAGGDTTGSAGPLSITVAVLGRTAHPVLRSGARPGDAVYVTGQLGGAAVAVQRWLHGEQPTAEQRAAFVTPAARTAEAQWLARRIQLHAMIDLSDGLLSDAAHLAAASDVAITIAAALVPRADSASLEHAAAGDDYELCFTATEDEVEAVRAAFEQTFATRLSRIGSVTAGAGAVVVDGAGNSVPLRTGYDHFKD